MFSQIITFCSKSHFTWRPNFLGNGVAFFTFVILLDCKRQLVIGSFFSEENLNDALFFLIETHTGPEAESLVKES